MARKKAKTDPDYFLTSFNELSRFRELLDERRRGGSRKKAATKAGVDPGQLMRSAELLRQRFDAPPFFEEDGNTPTDAGLAMYDYAGYLLSLAQDAAAEMKKTQVVRIGGTAIGLDIFVAEALESLFTKRQSTKLFDGRIMLEHMNYWQLLHAVRTGEVDFGITQAAFEIRGEGVRTELMDETERVLMYPKAYAIHSAEPVHQLEELSERPFIYLTRDIDQIEDELAIVRLLNIGKGGLIGAPSAPMVRAYVTRGLGIAFGVMNYPECAGAVGILKLKDIPDETVQSFLAKDSIRSYLFYKEGVKLEGLAAEIRDEIRLLHKRQTK